MRAILPLKEFAVVVARRRHHAEIAADAYGSAKAISRGVIVRYELERLGLWSRVRA
jgi:hypothetical protein